MPDLLVTGADRRLGGAVMAVARRAGYDVVGWPAGTLDEAPACERLVADLRPRAIVDCDDRGRGDPDAAPAPGRCAMLARAAASAGALSILVSTAEVFDGRRPEPYVESDVAAPDTPAGVIWLAAERAVAAENPRHAIVRVSWLFGGAEPDLVEDICAECTKHGRVSFDAVSEGTPTAAGDVAAAVLRLVGRQAYGIFHLAGGAATRLALARLCVRALALPARPVPAEMRHEPAAGLPRRRVLATRRDELPALPDWRLAVAGYLDAGAATGAPDVA